MADSAHSRAVSITESPWYWVALFCTAGIVALIIMGPKFAERQLQIERKALARQDAARHAAGTPQVVLRDSEAGGQALVAGTTAITLWPLFVVLSVLLVVAWIKVLRFKIRHGRVLAASQGNVDS